MSIKETIRAEVDARRQNMVYELYQLPDESEKYIRVKGMHDAYVDMLIYLDHLPEQPVEKTSYDTQKYTPRPSVSIEDVARVQFASHAKLLDKKRKAVFDWEQFKEVTSIFYGFGKNDSPETKEKEQPASEELEKEIARYLREECSADDEPSISDIARHFAEWGAEHLKK